MREAFAALRPAAEFALLEAGRPLALGGRLDRRHERHPRRHDPAAQLLRRRRLAGPRADADAGDRRPPRGGDPGLQARALLARRREPSRRPARRGRGASASTAAASTPGGQAGRRGPAHASEELADAIVAACAGEPGTITKLEKKEQREKAPMLYDLTSLQREANTRYGFSARRTLAAAQRLYEEHKALTYPRTNSRYLTSDMVERDQADRRAASARAREYRDGRRLRDRPRRAAAGARRQRREGHRPPRDHPDPLRAPRSRRWTPTTGASTTWSARRFLAVFHPEAVFENTRVETTVDGAERTRPCSARAASCCSCPAGAASTARPPSDAQRRGARRGGRGRRPAAAAAAGGRAGAARARSRALRKETKPPRRYSDASLLGAMETAGKLVDDDELREAMKDSGIGTPATRAAIIERLIDGRLRRARRARAGRRPRRA